MRAPVVLRYHAPPQVGSRLTYVVTRQRDNTGWTWQPHTKIDMYDGLGGFTPMSRWYHTRCTEWRKHA